MDKPCRDCGARIRWATTSRGYRKPFDVDPSADGEYLLHFVEPHYDRDERIVPGGWRAEWVSQAFRVDAELHADHRDVCVARTVSGACA